MSEQLQFVERRAEPYPCAKEAVIAGLLHDRDDIKKTMETVSSKLDLILAQITKVAILEERHSNSVADIDRAHGLISKLEKDVRQISDEIRAYINETKGMAKMAWTVWTILSSAVGLMLVKVLFFASNNPV